MENLLFLGVPILKHIRVSHSFGGRKGATTCKNAVAKICSQQQFMNSEELHITSKNFKCLEI